MGLEVYIRGGRNARWSGLYRTTALCLVLSLVSMAVAAAAEKKKLSVENIMELLAGGVAMPRITFLVKERGTDFQLTPRLQQAFNDAGADEDLIRTLRSQQTAPETTSGIAPKQEAPAAQPPGQTSVTATGAARVSPPPTKGQPLTGLQIRSKPGDVSVFVDDEPKGTTDPEEGFLQVAPLKPGKHRLRATHEGYQNVEGTVEIAAGQMLETPLWLAKAEVAGPASSAPSLPAGKKFLVRHQHLEAGYCQGWLIVNVGYVQYISTDSPHKYLMSTSEIREAKAGSGPGGFFINLGSGRKYQFVAVDEKGNAVGPRPVLAEVQYSMGK